MNDQYNYDERENRSNDNDNEHTSFQQIQEREASNVSSQSGDEAIALGSPDNGNQHQGNPNGGSGGSGALLNQGDREQFRTRWHEIQGKFVDEPRSAVQQADQLVEEVVTQITRMFENERGQLEGQWKQGNNVSTEDLRVTLQHYRTFFNRLVV